MSDCCNHNHHTEKKESIPAGRDIIYTCPMHPEIRQETSGMCPECGMQLIAATRKNAESASWRNAERRGQKTGKHAGHSTKAFLKKFWISLILTIPLVAYSELPELFFSISLPIFPGIDYLILVLGSIVFFYGGWVFLIGSYRELKGRLPGMMTLIALAIIAAYLWSVYAIFTNQMPLFWELGTLITIMLLGHWIEMKAVQGARGALQELAKLLPDTAERVLVNPKSQYPNSKQITNSKSQTSQTEIVPISNLKAGDIVLVKPGAKVPADGKISEGQTELDESIVTGESKPVEKKVGDEVIAGTINGDGSLKVEITKTGKDTFLAGVMKMVAEAQASKSRLQILSDKAALWLTIVAVTAGSITLVAWLVVGQEVAFAVARLVAVLVIACPHALGLAVPLVASISTNMAASNGFIIKKRLALEAARNVDIVLFDKTGTLTKGEFGVTNVTADTRGLDAEERGTNENKILQLAASVNSHSEHSIAKAIVKDAQTKNIQLHDAKDFQRIAGKGAAAELRIKNEELRIIVGSQNLMEENEVEIGEDLKENTKELESQGKTVIWVASRSLIPNSKFILQGLIALEDVIREESREAIKTLHSQNIKTAMITGDSEDVAKWVSGELGIDEYFARVLPGEKAEKVKKLQSRGLKVAMVGDGVNDAPALTQADIGIAIGAGTNVAIESAGIILVKNDPRDIPKITRLSKLTYTKMIQNLFWATGYNIIALPLAAGALVVFGVPAIDPAVGAIFMSASTVIVAINALFLRRREL